MLCYTIEAGRTSLSGCIIGSRGHTNSLDARKDKQIKSIGP
jgi:hypothetical protein